LLDHLKWNLEKFQSWPLQGDPWLDYRTKIDFLAQVDEDPALQASRSVMMATHSCKPSLLISLRGRALP